MLARPMPADHARYRYLRDARGDRVYSFLLVTSGFTTLKPSLPMWSIGIMVVGSLFMSWVLWFGIRELREHLVMRKALRASAAKRAEIKQH
jgi:hypothetical protein